MHDSLRGKRSSPMTSAENVELGFFLQTVGRSHRWPSLDNSSAIKLKTYITKSMTTLWGKKWLKHSMSILSRRISPWTTYQEHICMFIFYFWAFFFVQIARGWETTLSAQDSHSALTTSFIRHLWTDNHDLRTFRRASLYIYITFYIWLLQIL